MFTGIIETTARVISLSTEENNLELWLESAISAELKIDQSVAHNGVCLTVTDVSENTHRVTAIRETLLNSNLGDLVPGSEVNLERCMRLGDRLDGHMVQGHVDTCGRVQEIIPDGGSFLIRIAYPQEKGFTVKKGSICVNGVSLTVVESSAGLLSVAIIPYTWEHTNLRLLQMNDPVNLEFDLMGKYIVELFNQNVKYFINK